MFGARFLLVLLVLYTSVTVLGATGNWHLSSAVAAALFLAWWLGKRAVKIEG